MSSADHSLLISADAHVAENENLRARLPEHLRERMPLLVPGTGGDLDDEINGKGVVYDFKKKTGNSAVKIKEGKIEFMYQIFNDIYGVFDGDKFTAPRIDGAYIDNWIKVK